MTGMAANGAGAAKVKVVLQTGNLSFFNVIFTRERDQGYGRDSARGVAP